VQKCSVYSDRFMHLDGVKGVLMPVIFSMGFLLCSSYMDRVIFIFMRLYIMFNLSYTFMRGNKLMKCSRRSRKL